MADHSAYTFTPLHWAASQGHTEMLLGLVSAGADANILSAGKTPLELATQGGYLETVEAISAYIAKLESASSHSETEHQNQLFRAAKSGDFGLILDLIADETDANLRNPEGQTLLNVAVLGTEPNRTGIILELIARGADVNAKDSFGQTAVHYAVSDMLSTSSLEALISAGANVNLWDNACNTPLHLAAGYSKESVVILLENDAVVDARNSMGSTPLHEAAFYGEAESVAALIGAGAEIDARNMWGESPLHRAAGRGSPATVRTLIGGGANVHTLRGEACVTPLHEAAGHGKTANARALIHAGADVNARTTQGHTAYAIAADKCHTETALAIEAEGDR